MPLARPEAIAFLDVVKTVPGRVVMRWTRRNANAYIARLPLEVGAIRSGELFLMTSAAQARCWRFKVLRHSAEVLRWDFTVPPSRHRNRRACGEEFPKYVTELEHEHLLHPTEGLACASPLPDLAGLDHRQALDAFCRRANIDVQADYVAPPPPHEQLAFDARPH